MAQTLEQMADADLIAAVRQGDVAAFGTLYERHLTSAKRAAACLVRTHAEREDLVAEAFTRVLRILRDGRGPDEEFRPYLLVTLRNTAIHSATRGTPVSLYAELPDAYLAEDRGDPVIDRWDAHVAATAFASLPERWRVVLWHTEVEKESPSVVATLLGMRPNSVAALAYRAREGLRQAYLRMHVPQPPRPECAQTVKKLAAYVRRNVPVPLSHKISRHLDRCGECRARAELLTKLNAEIAGLLAPVVLGAPLAAAYLQAPVTAVTAALAATATDTGLATGMLAVKAGLFKAGAAALVAATAVTTTAAAPAGSSQAGPVPITIVDGTRGTRGSTFSVPGPPLRTVIPSVPAGAGAELDERPGERDGNGDPNRGRARTPTPEAPPGTAPRPDGPPSPGQRPPVPTPEPPTNPGIPAPPAPPTPPAHPGRGNPPPGKPGKPEPPSKTGQAPKPDTPGKGREPRKTGQAPDQSSAGKTGAKRTENQENLLANQ